MDKIILDSILLFFFFLRLIQASLYQIYLWQLKEYRFDRMLAHLSTDQGRRSVLNPLFLGKWLLFIFSLLFFSPVVSTWIFSLVLGIYLSEVYLTWKKRNVRFKIPKLTSKAFFIIFASFSFLLVGLIWIPLTMVILVQLLDRLLPGLVVLAVLIAAPPSFLFKKIVVFWAKKKISLQQDLIVIGITGSFGKTSTKEFLASILSNKYKVLKTKGSVNTEIGVAQTVIKNLSSFHQIFLVEMGAYKPGEIAAIAKIVKPQIGIITGINQQHLQLFGKIERTMEAKFELIKSLKKEGAAFFNIGNKNVQKMAAWCRKQRPDLQIWRYFCLSEKTVSYVKKKQDVNCILYAKNLKAQLNNIFFTLIYKEKELRCAAKLTGASHVDNILAAVAVALKLGMSFEEIKRGVNRLEPPPKTMRLVKGIKEAKFIDDTFNANPDGVIAVLKFMKLFSGRKILVLTPLIELGEASEEVHRFLGREIAKECDLVLLTNENYNKPFFEGAEQIAGAKSKIHLVDAVSGEKIIRQNIQKDGVVVFEGKEARKILEQLVPQKEITT